MADRNGNIIDGNYRWQIMEVKLWTKNYDGKLWRRNVMANYGEQIMEDNLWKANYGGQLWKVNYGGKFMEDNFIEDNL